jgi:uncharacterized protein YdhG (YjbR/CyaY superfamily)
MPSFSQDGILIYFAAFKNHIGVFPPVSGDPRLERSLSRYMGPKGNLKFPLGEPVPYPNQDHCRWLRETLRRRGGPNEA